MLEWLLAYDDAPAGHTGRAAAPGPGPSTAPHGEAKHKMAPSAGACTVLTGGNACDQPATGVGILPHALPA